jgi:4-hydroxy-2-oxoheptanedioate aldolase
VRDNRILTQLEKNEAAIGAALNINSPHLVELIGSLGFDWVFIDGEHGSMSDPEIENMIRAAETYGMASVVRVAANEPQLILHMLDAGAMGIVVPHVDTLADAEKAAAAAKYPPLGERGSNYGTGRNNEYGAGFSDIREYYSESNRRTILFALIESGTAVENFDEIIAVDGIDASWLGPADMALSMGMPGQSVIDAALDEVVRKTVAAGKISAVTHPGPGAIDQLAGFRKLGATIFATPALALLNQSAAKWQELARRL